eukprot:jgi/Astpho2/6077/Aster-04024
MPSGALCADQCLTGRAAEGLVHRVTPEQHAVRGRKRTCSSWGGPQAPGRTGRAPLTAFAVSTSRAEAPSTAEELSPEDDWEDSAPASEAAASELTGAELFSRQHVGRWTPAMAAYFPFGCMLAAVRMLAWVALLTADQPWLTDNDTSIRVLQFLLGIDVSWRGTERLPPTRHVMVSNHQTAGDLMILYRLPKHYVHLISAKLPRRISKAQNHRVRLWHATRQIYDELADSTQYTESVHLFPEGGMTNGAGMMRFSRGFLRFGRDLPIAPVVLRASVPWNMDLQTHTLTSSFLSNLFWFCWAPSIRLEARVLQPMTMRTGEGNGAFVERVQQAIATELGTPISNLTLQGKRKLMQAAQKKA